MTYLNKIGLHNNHGKVYIQEIRMAKSILNNFVVLVYQY